MSSACVRCSRWLLVAMALLFLVFGLTLCCLCLWLRFDQQIERALRQQLLADPAQAPAELTDLKMEFQVAYAVVFWALLGFSSAVALVGFVGLCAGCSRARPINAFLCMLLIMLILFQVGAYLAIALFRHTILEHLDRYLSISLQYNLTDATVIRHRFACCGDGNYQMSYNYQCQGLGQPNCRNVLHTLFGAILAGMAIFVATNVMAQLLAAVLAGILVCNNKYTNLNEVH